MAKKVLTLPTHYARQLAEQEGLFYAPRQLTAMAKRGEIPSVTTADGVVVLIDDRKARDALRSRRQLTDR
jgi:hypothetical protein